MRTLVLIAALGMATVCRADSIPPEILASGTAMVMVVDPTTPPLGLAFEFAVTDFSLNKACFDESFICDQAVASWTDTPNPLPPGTIGYLLPHSADAMWWSSSGFYGTWFFAGTQPTPTTELVGGTYTNYFNGTIYLADPIATPEPSSLALTSLGLLGIIYFARRKPYSI